MRFPEIQCPRCSNRFFMYEPLAYTECFGCACKLRVDEGEASVAGAGDDPGFEEVLSAIRSGTPDESMNAVRDYYRDTLEGPGVDMIEGLMKMCDPAAMTDEEGSWKAAFACWNRAVSKMPDDFYLAEYMEIIGYAVTSWSDSFDVDADSQSDLFKAVEPMIRERFSGDYYYLIYWYILKGCTVYIERADPGSSAVRMLEMLSLEYMVDDPDYRVQIERQKRIIRFSESHPDLPYTADMSFLSRLLLEGLEERTAGLTEAQRETVVCYWDNIRIATELGPRVADMHIASVLEQSCTELDPSILDRLFRKGNRKFSLTFDGSTRKFYVPKDSDLTPVEYSYQLVMPNGNDLGPSSTKACVDAYLDVYMGPVSQ